jgi:NADH-quinone oxidoreductase subunit L
MEFAVVFLPLIAAAVAGFGRRQIGARGAEILTAATMCVSAVLAIGIFYQYAVLGHAATFPVLEWINSGTLHLSWALRMDVLTAVMMLVVTSVSAMVHIYSIGYMAEDPSRAKFMSYLSFFTFMMLMLVTADNFVQLFFGWEGVGLASYLLIGFWNHKPSANDAAMKAFIVNRVGDFGFALGIFTVFALFGTLNFADVFNAVPTMGAGRLFYLFGHPFDAMTLACVLLFVGAMGKSAQLGLHTWLPDAMEGPTPVSALIHAATMVTAGVFMLVRISPLLDAAPVARDIIVVVGALTAFVGAAIAFGQFDIKKVIAYSTMSQLGYMVFAAGATAYGGAIFHLFTHAFFKALLFLGAGAVIHAMHHEQDMRHYGGLYKKLPITYALMWIGTLALIGFPFFAGYYSKDMILEAEWAGNNSFDTFAYVVGVAVAFMTAAYSGKVMFMTFHGKARYDENHAHIHEAPLVMLIPLFVLAAGAILSGMIAYDYFVGDHYAVFWETAINPKSESVLHAAELDPLWVKLLPAVAALSGLAFGWVCYVWRPNLPAWFAKHFALINKIIVNKFYFDKVYGAVFAAGAPLVGKILWRYGDLGIIDKYGPDGAARASTQIAGRISKFQTGFLYHYAFVMLMALVLFIAWLLFGRMGT